MIIPGVEIGGPNEQQILADLCTQAQLSPPTEANGHLALVRFVEAAHEAGRQSRAQAAGQKAEAEVLARPEPITIK